MAIVGIDLGTTNSLIAVYDDNEVKIVQNRLKNNLTPSVVSIMDNHLLIGQSAKERQVKYPKQSASAFKRFMGTNKTYSLNNNTLDPIELSSLILKSLIEDAEAAIDEKITEAVISVPAYFNDKQRNATIEAANLAGINVNRLLNEPTAAAVAYHMHDKNEETVVAIVDLGGGTFDVSILDIFDSVVEVRAVSGDNYLGGEDFDEAIMKYIITKLNLEECIDLELLAKLKYSSEAAKIALTTEKSVLVKLSHNNKTYELEITEQALEQIAEPLLLRLKDPLKKAINDSNFSLSDIDEVILVGGSTRMPLVKKFVARLFGKLPLAHLNPDEVVVRGAAITAAMIGRHESLEDTVLTDVCPYTLGTTIIQYTPEGGTTTVYDPIIERNQTVPLSKSRTYSNFQDNQKQIRLDIYQGDSFKIENNLKLGEIISPIPKGPSGTVDVEVRFTYDLNGILEVELYIPSTDTRNIAIMMNNNELSDNEIKSRLDQISHLKIHPRDQEENLYLISSAERLYEMHLGKNRSSISTELIRFNEDLEKQNREVTRQAVKRMKEFITYMEESN